MPSPTDGGALEERLQALVVAPSDVPEVNLMAAESGFYDADSVVSIQEDPSAAAERYASQGLKGSYMRIFEASGSIRQVQASILNFDTAAGADQEFAFGSGHESQGAALTPFAAPFERSFALVFKTEIEQTTLSGVLVVWVHDVDVSTVYVAGTDEEETVSYAMRVAHMMHGEQQAKRN
jgi:hypothetical protein